MPSSTASLGRLAGVQVGTAMDERDERSRLTKMDLVPVISAMLLSSEVRAQRVSLRALVSLFGAAMYMEPLHPEGEAVAMILPRLRNCLLSDGKCCKPSSVTHESGMRAVLELSWYFSIAAYTSWEYAKTQKAIVGDGNGNHKRSSRMRSSQERH